MFSRWEVPGQNDKVETAISQFRGKFGWRVIMCSESHCTSCSSTGATIFELSPREFSRSSSVALSSKVDNATAYYFLNEGLFLQDQKDLWNIFR